MSDTISVSIFMGSKSDLPVVQAAADTLNEFNIPLMLIASRRQIESKKLGGGYVNNWSTEEFSKYFTNAAAEAPAYEPISSISIFFFFKEFKF